MKAIKIAVAASITSMLFGCGGGSDSPASGSSAQTGYFIDSAVKGLTYSTATQSGTTGAQGDFKYMPGEDVTFKLYGTTLNTAYASLLLTPADANNVDIDYTINLLRLLQTIDTDNDTSNGIDLPAVDAADANYQFDLAQDIYTFETDANVQAFLTKYASGRSLVGIKDAITHFNASIAGADTGEVVLDVTGKTMKFTQYDNRCAGNSAMETGSYALGETTWVETITTGYGFNDYTGVLGSATCTLNGTGSTASNVYKTGNSMFTFQGGPKYSYTGMNRIGIRSATVTPTNGLESVVVLWHTPGTKQITYLRRYIKTDGVTWTKAYHTLKWVYTWQ